MSELRWGTPDPAYGRNLGKHDPEDAGVWAPQDSPQELPQELRAAHLTIQILRSDKEAAECEASNLKNENIEQTRTIRQYEIAAGRDSRNSIGSVGDLCVCTFLGLLANSSAAPLRCACSCWSLHFWAAWCAKLCYFGNRGSTKVITIFLIDGVRVPIQIWRARQLFGEYAGARFTYYEVAPKPLWPPKR